MTGKVYGRQPRVTLIFRLPGYPDLELEFVIDTGFDGFLTLPPDAVSALNLTFLNRLFANFANNVDEQIGVHEATILWDGAEQTVEVLATGRRPLLGTALLDGYDVFIPFEDGGVITITRR